MSGYGNGPNIKSAVGAHRSTAVPLEFLNDLRNPPPVPITISGSGQVTFTVNASVANPVKLWSGTEYITMKTSKAYTWAATANTILSSAAASTSLTGSTLGVWYFYLSIASTGVTTLLPSQTAPVFAEGPYPGGYYTHPGTSRGVVWNYVGYHVCTTAATPVFLAAEKHGRTYEFAAQVVATTTTWALLDFSAVLPAHGVTCSGYLETSTTLADTTEIGASSTDLRGAIVVKTPAAVITQAPFAGQQVLSSGKFYGSSTTAAGNVGVSRVVDVL